jgi:hypothetical protein
MSLAVNPNGLQFEEGPYQFGDRKGLELANDCYLNGLRHSKKRVLLRRGFVSGSSS